MSEETIAGRLFPEWDDCSTLADHRRDPVPLPPPITRERAVILLDVDDTWMADAACTGEPQLWWYPPGEGPGRIDVVTRELEQNAKDVCATCTVRAACLEYALATNEEFGIWGGLAPRERGLLRRSAGRPLLKSDSMARRRREQRRRDGIDNQAPPPDVAHDDSAAV